MHCSETSVFFPSGFESPRTECNNDHSHLSSTVATLAAKMLAMGQQPSGPRALEGQPGINEGCGTTVVIHKERLMIEMQTHSHVSIKSTQIPLQ